MSRTSDIKEIRQLKRNIERRLNNIGKNEHGLTVAHFAYFKIEPQKKLKDYNDTEIGDLKRALKRFDQRSFSHVRGYKKYLEYEDTFNSLPVEYKAKVYKLYDNFVEDNRYLDNYKYEVMNEITEKVIESHSDLEIKERIDELYNNIVAYEEGNLTYKEAFETSPTTKRLYR